MIVSGYDNAPIPRLVAWTTSPGASGACSAATGRGAKARYGWLFPPADIHAAEAWDQYWRGQLEHGIGPPLQDIFCHEEPLLDAIEQRGLKTVLCVGSGISQEPHALAAAGLDVIALDISPFAIRFASQAVLNGDEHERFLGRDRTRPGGTARFEVGNLLDPAVFPGPFDVVIERRTLQVFPEPERAAALSAVTARLSERGILLTHCHDGSWRPPAAPRHVIEPLLGAGFCRMRPGAPLPPDGRAVMIIMSTG